jgi:hypothetical protein
MSKPIVMTPGQWDTVIEKIKSRERPSVYLSREKMKAVLGFTVRVHHEDKKYMTTVRLDFYDERKRTMFLLTYGNGQG